MQTNYTLIHTVEDAVEALIAQEIVAIFQGHSEWGPRALGNRSFLYDPRNTNAKERVNMVKRREWWRPFAASILLDHAADYFEMGTLKESPYMAFSIPAKQKAKDLVPSVIHVNGTCRIQTVTREQNKNYWDLISAFHKKTGCPMLFNTSFNLAGEPIVETIEHAKDTVERAGIKYLYTPL